MKVLNTGNLLPEPLRLVVEKISNEYDPGDCDVTATGIIKPHRIAVLSKKHSKTTVNEAINLIPSVWGSSIHNMLEMAANGLEDYITEVRFYITVSGMKLGAKIDLYDKKTKTLWDWKSTSVYNIMKEDHEEYAQQLNIGAECLRQNGLEVEHLRVGAFARDWRPGELKKSIESGKSKYPKKMFIEIEIPLIDSKEVLEWLEERIKGRKKAEKKLPNCTLEETWYGRRCQAYCDVASVCSQFKSKLNKEKKSE